jgi:hypothetical protein
MINIVLSILLFVVMKAVFVGIFAHGWSRRKLLLSAASVARPLGRSGTRRSIAIIPPLMESHDGHVTVFPLTSGVVETHARFSESARMAART